MFSDQIFFLEGAWEFTQKRVIFMHLWDLCHLCQLATCWEVLHIFTSWDVLQHFCNTLAYGEHWKMFVRYLEELIFLRFFSRAILGPSNHTSSELSVMLPLESSPKSEAESVSVDEHWACLLKVLELPVHFWRAWHLWPLMAGIFSFWRIKCFITHDFNVIYVSLYQSIFSDIKTGM